MPYVSSAPVERLGQGAGEDAWAAFTAEHSALMLRVARAVTRDEDAAMDAYAFMLEKLREHGSSRLAAYRETAGCTFATWLAVVTRRLCFDHHRARYGRPRADTEAAREAHAERRRLADLVATTIDRELAAPDGAADALDRGEILHALQRTIDGLPTRDRLLLRYRFDDGISVREIGRLLKYRTVFHVYRRLSTVLNECRRSLGQLGFQASDV